MVTSFGLSTIDQIIADINDAYQQGSRVSSFPRMPFSQSDEFGTLIMCFTSYNLERREVYALGLPTAKSTDRYWQFLEGVLQRDKLPIVVVAEAPGGYLFRFMATERNEHNAKLFDYFHSEFKSRKANPDHEDTLFIDLFDTFMNTVGKTHDDGTDAATD
jgi:hypothetical protein